MGFQTGGQAMAKRRKRTAEQRKAEQSKAGKNALRGAQDILDIIRRQPTPKAAEKGTSPYGQQSISQKQKKLTEWERKQQYRKKVQDMGGNVIFADEWDKIDPGLKKGIGLHKGGTPRKVGKGPEKRKYPKRKQIPVKKEIEKRMREETPLTYGISKFGKTGLLRRHLHKNRIKKELAGRPDHLERPKVKLAGGGISGKSTVGELRKKYGSLKKGIRLKGKGSSFIEEYKKRVYGRSKGGSMVQGPMKRARGSGAAIKGTRFQGTF